MKQPSKLLFLIAGNAGVGKDAFADALESITRDWADVHRDAYAYGIKKIVHDSYGVPWEILNGNKDVKESSFVYVGREKTKVTVRRALQKIGQFHRETFGATCWANAALQRAMKSGRRLCVITDARHPTEEVHWIGEEATAAGFLVIPVRLYRPSIPVNLDHPSESLIHAEPDSSFSFIVDNEGSLDDLYAAAERIACAAVVLQKTGRKKLRKSDSGYLVRNEKNKLPYEPLLTPIEVDQLAERLQGDEIQYSIEAMSFESLRGAACVRN